MFQHWLNQELGEMTSAREARIVAAKKLIGETVEIIQLWAGYDPANDPDKENLVYVPLPEYGIALRKYHEPQRKGV